MAQEIPPWTKAGLPGRPVVQTSGGALEDIACGRVLHGLTGKVIYFDNEQTARYVADVSTEYLGKAIHRVFFMRRNGERQQQTALTAAKDASLTKMEIAAIEAFAWLRAREAGKVKRKRVRVTV